MIKKRVFMYHLLFLTKEGILVLQLHSVSPEKLLPPQQCAAPRSRTKTTFIFFRKSSCWGYFKENSLWSCGRERSTSNLDELVILIEACFCSIVFYFQPNLMQLQRPCRNTLGICCCWDTDYRTVPFDFDMNKQKFQLAQQTLCVKLIWSVLCCCMLCDVIIKNLQNHWALIHCWLGIICTKTVQRHSRLCELIPLITVWMQRIAFF